MNVVSSSSQKRKVKGESNQTHSQMNFKRATTIIFNILDIRCLLKDTLVPEVVFLNVIMYRSEQLVLP